MVLARPSESWKLPRTAGICTWRVKCFKKNDCRFKPSEDIGLLIPWFATLEAQSSTSNQKRSKSEGTGP